ncbi:cadherin-related family member 5 [Chiroxiphia lanceolata]|uniref:cadherin-related family member 5 n=1 Tax=Chiroxiphia lanceolata TaxID=296741 RepID=UPI0013CEDB57|nr:cadherin-related family member 5 [Chiroxiphia lanceolata]
MAVSRWLLTPVLVLLPLMTWVSAQQQGCSVSNSNPKVPENNPVNYEVTTIHVETGFTVSIDPRFPDGSFFTIQGDKLLLTKVVDYEEDPLLVVYLNCEDSTGQSDSLEIIVTILNENDNDPQFQQPNLTRSVREDTEVNATIVAREDLTATDADLDIIYYELTATVQGTDGYFAIKGVNNPEIYLQKALDYDKFQSTRLLLYARDRPVGSTDVTRTATATITLLITQADTRAPWFLPCALLYNDTSVCISSPYSGIVNISELAVEPLTLRPGPIYAVDPDYTINEKIVYSIVGGNTDEVFSVDADTGNLTMNKIVTSPDSFLLQVMATQANNVRKNSVATVEIKVINKSLYPPHFERELYSGTVVVGLAPRSFVFQAGDPSTPLTITAADEDFPDKFNPNIEYYIKNSTDFIATRDGLILTNVVLQSPGTVSIEAVGRDVLSLQEASTVIEVEVLPATDETSSDKMYSAQDMAILGGTLAALLLIVLIFLGVLVWKSSKWYGKPVKHLLKKKLSKEVSGGHHNEYYQEYEYPDVSTTQDKTPENGSVRSETGVLEQPAPPLPSRNAGETESLSRASTASSTISNQGEKEEEVEEETRQEKEVKSILKTDRHVGDDGYKAVWFKTDVDPEAGERVEVIENNAAADDDDDDSDQDLRKNEEEEEDSHLDDQHRGLGLSFASESSSLPAAEETVNVSYMDAVTGEESEL